MPREKEAFRDNLERLLAFMPEREMLCMKDVSKFTGLDIKTVKKLFTFKNNYVSKASLARQMS